MAKYLKQDSDLGYVEDGAEIEYLKFNNLRHTILGYMWGDFNSQGEYVLSPEIEREMIAMQKYVVDTIDNIEVCLSNIKFDKQITFIVTTEGNRATLSLVEKINFEANNKLNAGTYSNINEYILDEVETSGVVDKNALYRRWNISFTPGEVLDIFHIDDESLASLFGLTARFKYLIKANEILLNQEEKLEEVEAEYSINLLSIIDHYPKLKLLVDEELKKTLSEKKDFIRIDRPNFAKTLNEVIEKSTNANLNILTEEERSEFLSERRNAQVTYNIKSRDTVGIKSETLEVKQEHIGNELSATKKDRIILDTHDLEQGRSIIELMQGTIQAEKDVVERNISEAIAVNVGDVKNAPVADASRLLVAIGNAGKKAVLGTPAHGKEISSYRAELYRYLSNKGATVTHNTSQNTSEQISQIEKGRSADIIVEQANQPTKTDSKQPVKETQSSANKSAGSSSGGGSGRGGGGSAGKKVTVKKVNGASPNANGKPRTSRSTSSGESLIRGAVKNSTANLGRKIDGTLASKYAQKMMDNEDAKQNDEGEKTKQADTLLTSNKMNNLRGRRINEVVKTKAPIPNTRINTNSEDILYEENTDDKILSQINEQTL